MDYNVNYRKKDKGIQAIVSYKVGNKWKQKSKQGFEDSRLGKRKAKEWAENTIQELKELDIANIDMQDITFKEYSNLFLEDKKIFFAENTILKYKKAFKAFGELNNKQLKEINVMDIQRIVNKMCNIYSTGTIRIYLSSIKCSLNVAAKKYKFIKENPCTDIEYVSSKKIINKKKALNKYEVDKLLKILKGNKTNKHYIVSLIAVKCGLRVGEICRLTWDSIDFNNNTLTVNKQRNINKDGINTFTKLKTKNSYRTVPFSNEVKRELIEYKKSKVTDIYNRVVVVKSSKSLSNNMNNKFIKCGFNITIHSLRHTYATNLIANGLDFKTTAKLLGHTVEQTMKTYSHVNDDMMDNARKIINIL